MKSAGSMRKKKPQAEACGYIVVDAWITLDGAIAVTIPVQRPPSPTVGPLRFRKMDRNGDVSRREFLDTASNSTASTPTATASSASRRRRNLRRR